MLSRSSTLGVSLRAVSRQNVRPAARYASHHAKKQPTTGVTFGLAATTGLVGWTGLIAYVIGRPHTVHHKSTHSAPPTPDASSASTAPSETPSTPPSEDAASSQQAAYDPETGEINWDCPCLGGMATGPCGEEFKAAFSCFVHSEDEPKGVDCVEKFRGMQECFRKYPEIYGNDEEEESEEELVDRAEAWLAVADEEFLPKEVEEAAQLE